MQELGRAEDEYVVKEYIAGDEKMFAELVTRHLHPVYSYAFRLTGDVSDAEDIAQESFLKTWKHIRDFDPRKARFKTWLMRIVRNTTIDQLRKKKALPLSVVEDTDEETITDTLQSEEPLQDEVAARAEDTAALERAIQKLSLEQRETLLLYNGNDFSFEEIGSILGVPRNTVKSRYRRALGALKKLLMHPNG